MRLLPLKRIAQAAGSLVVAGMLVLLPCVPNTYAFAATPTSETGVALAANDGDSFLTIEDTFDTPLVREAYLADIRKVREDAWDRNLPFEGVSIREYLAQNYPALASKSAYANAVKWDSALEKVAIQRAYETEAHLLMAHIRPNGAQYYTAKPDGTNLFFAENVAWGAGSTTDLATTVKWSNFGVEGVFSNGPSGWYLGEIEALKQLNGKSGYTTINGQSESSGHIYTILNPRYTYHAVAATHHKILAGAYSATAAGNEQGIGWTGKHSVTMAVKAGIAPDPYGATTRIEVSQPEHKEEQLDAPATQYEDSEDLFVGETKVKQEAIRPVYSYDLVTKTFYPGTGNGLSRMTGAPTSYVLGTEKTNEKTTAGQPEIVLRGIATKETEDTTTKHFETKYVYNHEKDVSYSKVVQDGKDEIYTVTYKVVRGERKGEINRQLKQELQDKVVERGTLQTRQETSQITTPYTTNYEFDASLGVNEEKEVQAGRDKVEEITYDVTVDTQKQNAEVSRTEAGRRTVDAGQPKIIKRGYDHKAEEWLADPSKTVAHDTKTEDDITLDEGTTKVVQEGKDATFETKTIVYYDAAGKVIATEPTNETRPIQEKQDQIEKVGVRRTVVETREEAIPFDTQVVYDHSRLNTTDDVVTTEGKDGKKVITTTRHINSRTLEEIDSNEASEVTLEPQTKVISKGSLALSEEKTRTESIPAPTEPKVIYNNNRFEDEVEETAGVPGEKLVTYQETIDTQDNNRVVDTKVLSEKITKEAVAPTRTVGTKKRPQKLALLNQSSTEIHAGDTVSMRVNAEPEGLVRVLLDGNELTQGVDYSVAHGSTIITLSNAQSKALAAGEHTLVAEYKETEAFEGGSVQASFTVLSSENAKPAGTTQDKPEAAPQVGQTNGNKGAAVSKKAKANVLPKTGDIVAPFASIVLTAALALATSTVLKRRSQN